MAKEMLSSCIGLPLRRALKILKQKALGQRDVFKPVKNKRFFNQVEYIYFIVNNQNFLFIHHPPLFLLN
jgi:hypothetical protein